MIDVHFLIPPFAVNTLLSRFHIYHKDGHQGYFGALIFSEIMAVISCLIDNGYRVDIRPGETYRMVARKESV